MHFSPLASCRMCKELLSIAFYRAVFTELLITAIYVFFGLGSVLDWPETPSILQISITFNLAAATVVQIAWRASGAHINPAVTVAFLLGSRVSLVRTVCYVVAQLAGGIVGAAILYAVTPENVRGNMGINKVNVNISAGQAVAVELILTLQLVLCYFASTDTQRSTGSPAVIIGVSVALGHLVGHYYTRCSMNPARSFGPAVITGNFLQQWIFWVGPLIGAILASVLYNFVIYYDPKPFSQRLSILKGSYDGEELKTQEETHQKESLSLPSLAHRL
ncbi:aquaporin-6-like isoform X1 [Crotalus tigris]|uniref:aquaporin-6-like isoform X1 n=1 Tax=Crotalus tigris TaxID=88082 RepID=UPI00192F643C|nr:aquaporin-6-like isoform X1 [Crotalus tigris]XP_039193245.1 aquaporin-6-like isoform X1 [Crotalus tigris]